MELLEEILRKERVLNSFQFYNDAKWTCSRKKKEKQFHSKDYGLSAVANTKVCIDQVIHITAGRERPLIIHNKL